MDRDTGSWGNCLQHAAISDIGMRRQNNQDAMNVMLAGDLEYFQARGHLFIVADGMGAHAAGELASKLAVDTVPHTYAKALKSEPATALAEAIATANTEIHGRGQGEAEFEGMGTTCTAMLLLPKGAILGHVGDSRAYLLRRGKFMQLTFDHSLVWEMKAAGQIADDQIDQHLPKNIITRSLGPNPQVKVDLEGPFPVAPGDIFLLCSDGLTGPVSDEEIAAIIGCLPAEEAVQALVDLANLRGGPDNITVLVLHVAGPPVAGGSADDDDYGGGGAHPLLWLVAGVCALAAGGMALLGSIIPAALCGIGAGVALIVAWMQHAESGKSAGGEVQFGRGPYKSYNGEPTAEVVNKLTEVTSQLRQAVAKGGLNVELGPFDKSENEARQAASAGDLAEAVRCRCRGMSYVVAQLKKNQSTARISDSHVDLI